MPLIAPKALNGLYFFCEPLAEGSFGVLYVAIHILTRQKVAIKILDKSKLGADAFRVRSEIEALKQLNHKYIYKLYQVVETKYYFYLILEYLSGGELFDYILQKEYLSEVEARGLFRQIVSAIGFAHNKGFYHRDLKPENILLDGERNVRIIDFGLCAKNTGNALLNTFCGSFAYAAPEVLANKEYCGSAADMWSLGVILYALLCGCLPFDPTKPEELPQKIGKGHFTVPENLSKSSVKLLTQLMCVDPKKRIKMDELRRHPWIVEGFMGHPVELDEERIPMHPLNMRIVKEISDYTHIPKTEMARMLQRRSFDYLMATYMIMEAALEENVFISLKTNGRLKDNSHPQLHSALAYKKLTPSTSFKASNQSQSANSADTEAEPLIASCPSANHLSNVVCADEGHFKPCISINGSFERISSPVDENSVPSCYPPQGTIESEFIDENISPDDVSVQPGGCVNRHDQIALSPSRSVDSQLPQLVKSLHNSQLTDLPLLARTNLDSDSSMPDSLGKAYMNSVTSASSTSSSLPHDFTRSSSNANEVTCSSCSTEEGNPTSTPSMGWRQLGRLREALKQKRTVRNTPDNRPITDRLRKTRHLNNVFLVRQGLTAAQVLEQIATTLRQHSIRFALKGAGYLCVITNDWGKTVLSFELELVYVSNRTVEPANAITVKRRMTLKPRPTTQVPIVVSADPHENRSANDSSGNVQPTPLKEFSNNAVPLKDSCKQDSGVKRLGIKIKRLRGDSFMYASLCRTILTMANVREKQ